MITVQFYENNTLFLSQVREQVPAVDETIRLKGRNGKVTHIEKINDHLIHAHITFPKHVKRSSSFRR